MRSLPLPAFLPLLLATCAGPSAVHSSSADAAAPRPLPALHDAVRVVETATLEPLRFEELLDRLAQHDVVFLGETHLDDVTHRVELAVLEGLTRRHQGKVVLSLEMFERDVQPVLDEYLAGRCDEASFLERARPWGNYATDYRPLVEHAREHGLAVVAANTPAALRRKVSSGGREALEALSPEERALLPKEILPADAAYWERVDRATRGHMDFGSWPDERRLYAGQNLWDNSMGEACADALAAHPGHAVVHVVGGFHVAYRDGTAAQLRARAPEATMAVVEIVPTPGLVEARPERAAETADYLVYAAEHARSRSDGLFAVSVPTELRYSLDVPDAATGERPAPLLVVLPDADERHADVRAYWRAVLGEEAAVAVVEPPYPARAGDLAPAGRWSGAGELRTDLAALSTGLVRLVEYATRRLPVDGERVVVAGRGLGGRAVLWSALYTEWLAARFVAVTPSGTGALRIEGLPSRPPATRALDVLVEPDRLEESSWILDDYRAVEVPTVLAPLDPDDEHRVEGVLRDALGLPAPSRAYGDVVGLVLERDLPRARGWAAILARRLERDGTSVRVLAPGGAVDADVAEFQVLSIGGRWTFEDLAEGRGIPLAPGAFGGTTVLVVPARATPEEREAWLALERDQVLRKRSMFAGLRVALEDGAPDLAGVLAELAEGGTRGVLIVPAVFCASDAEMRALEDVVRALDLELEPEWLPGLGGELCTQDD